MFGGVVHFHENGPVYEPLITDWNQLDSMVVPDENSGLLPRLVVPGSLAEGRGRESRVGGELT